MRITLAGVSTAGFLFLLPFFTLPGLFYADINSKFFLSIIFVNVLLVMAAVHVYRSRNTFTISGKWMCGALGLVLVSMYVSAAVGVYPARSLWSDIFWSSGTLFLTHLALLAVVLPHLLTSDDWRLARRAVAVSAAIMGALSIIGVNGLGAVSNILWVPLSKGSLTLGNETYFGAYLVLALVVAFIELARTVRGSHWWYGIIASSALIVCSPLILNYNLFTGSASISELVAQPFILLGLARASSAAVFLLLTFLAGVLLLKRFVPERFRVSAQYAWAGILLLCIGLGISLLFTPGSVVQEKYIEESTAARIIVWDSAREAIQDRPLFGAGPENFGIAVEPYFDTRLFYDENNNEIWFERGHNAFIDTLVTTGVVGLFVFSLLIFSYVFVVYRACRKQLIGETEAAILYAFPFVHLVQMQTGFDTIASYVLLTFVGSYVLWLETCMSRDGYVVPKIVRTAVSVALVSLALVSLFVVVGGEYSRQRALFESFNPTDPARQQVNLEKSLTRSSSFESLRLSSSSFILGSLDVLADRVTPARVNAILATAEVYERRYEEYIAHTPTHYRARINYVYLLLIETSLGKDRTEEAKRIITESYALSPGNPITPALDSVVELYSGNIPEAQRRMDQALALDPNVEFTQQVAAYLERQIKQFPSLDILTLTNL